MIIIGIDNGTTGTISILGHRGTVLQHCPMPSFIEQSYTKGQQNVSRIDYKRLRQLLEEYTCTSCFVVIERPMVNPGRFRATVSALRALEATLITIEELGIPYRYIDSREWQNAMLPRGLWKQKKTKTGKTQLISPGFSVLKKAAVDIARRIFPSVQTKDADSLLIAEYERRTHK